MKPYRRQWIVLLGQLAALAATAFGVRADEPVGAAVIRAQAGESEIVITTTPRLAGAIHSLTWNGKEFIDSYDHGRQLQSAANFDLGQPFRPETFNPTEAGARADGAGPRSSSKLLHLVAGPDWLQTTTQMAFWLRPGEKSSGHPAVNRALLSHHLLTKRVQIGFRELPHVIRYDVTFSVPLGERHRFAQFEALTGYMPPEFERFWVYDPAARELKPLSDGPGEQALPVVLATESGGHAMGIYSPDQPSPSYERVGYGRFRFTRERVNKWNCVFRIRNEEGIRAGEYSFRCFVVVGALETVTESMRALHAAFEGPGVQGLSR